VDIQHLISAASEAMLTDGHIMPMAHIELKSNDAAQKDINVIMALDLFSDSQSIPVQSGMIARVGWEECKKYPGHTPIAAGIYAEAWRITEPASDEQKMRPKLNPRRQETIIVETWCVEGPKTESYRLLVIRDHKKRVVDIGPAEGPKSTISMIFASFLQGIHDAQRPDEETIGRMERAISKRVAHLSPRQRQELRDFAKSEGIPEDMLDDLIG